MVSHTGIPEPLVSSFNDYREEPLRYFNTEILAGHPLTRGEVEVGRKYGELGYQMVRCSRLRPSMNLLVFSLNSCSCCHHQSEGHGKAKKIFSQANWNLLLQAFCDALWPVAFLASFVQQYPFCLLEIYQTFSFICHFALTPLSVS